MRLIDADALQRHGQRGGFVHWRDIENAPTVDAGTQILGTWTEKEVFPGTEVEELQSARCSNCGKYHTAPYMYYFKDFAFCPNCGAKMEGV